MAFAGRHLATRNNRTICMPTEPPLQTNGYRKESAKGAVPQIEFTYLRYDGCGLRKQKENLNTITHVEV